MFPKNTLVLFRKGEKVYKCGVFVVETRNPSLAYYLWGNDRDETTWEWVWIFKKLWDVDFNARDINRIIGYKENFRWQGLISVKAGAEEVAHQVRKQIGK